MLEKKNCKICDKPSAKYSCPKCGIAYCSLGCYRDKRHVGCTESFYKSQVEESMQAQKADDQAKEQMQSILQEFHEQTRQDSLDIGRVVADESDDSDSESDEESELAKRLDGIDLESSSDQTMDAIWSRLTNSEREAFLKMIESRDIADILETWTPWWTNASENSKIAELDGSGHQTLNSNNGSVPTVKNIGVPIQTLTKKVHPSVLFQIFQVILAYVYMMRHLNGAPHGENLSASIEVLTSSCPLLCSKVADVYSSAYEATVVALASIDPEMSHGTKHLLLTDCICVVGKPEYVASVLSDIHDLVTELLADKKLPKNEKKRLNNMERRVFFLLSLVLQMQQDVEAWEFMKTDALVIRKRFDSEAQVFAKGSNIIEIE